MNPSGYQRTSTLNERLYLAGESLAPPFALQYVISGTGSPDPQFIQTCLHRLTKIHPALNLALKGNQWKEKRSILSLTVHSHPFAEDWNDPLFYKPLNENGAEVHFFPGKISTFVFRVLHRRMDAKGLQLIIRNFFSFLRGETPPADPGFFSDHAFRQKLASPDIPARDGYRFRWPGFPLSAAAPGRFVTEVISVNERIEGVSAKCAVWYAQMMNQSCRMMIPVDLRRHAGVPESASNLSLPLFIHAAPAQPWQEIQAEILLGLSENRELAAEPLEYAALLLPQSAIRLMMSGAMRMVLRKKRFPISGIISDNGFVKLSAFSAPSFAATHVVSIPVYVPLSPFCVNIVSHEKKTHIAFNVPEGTDILSLKRSLREIFLPEEKTEDKTAISPEKESELNVLQQLWAEILRLPAEKIGQNDTFHHLGGDSLKLLLLLNEVREMYILREESTFMHETLGTGGQITLRSLLEIVNKFRHENTHS